MLSLIIPLYRSEPNLPRLFEELPKIGAQLSEPMEVVFVNDGSPDNCAGVLHDRLDSLPFRARVVHLSRNFGSFAAIAAGLREGAGDYFGVIAADLQEPPELIVSFTEILKSGKADVVFGQRTGRADPWFAKLTSNLFWSVYRRFINSSIPEGGVDVFGCTAQVRDHVVALREVENNLVALLFWVGFRRAFVPYVRRERMEGVSAWTFARRLRHSIVSIFSFTDLPLQLLLLSGIAGTLIAIFLGIYVLIARLTGNIPVTGYTALIITIVFFGGLTTMGMGIVGQYLWLAFQNSKQRPPFIVRVVEQQQGRDLSERNSPHPPPP